MGIAEQRGDRPYLGGDMAFPVRVKTRSPDDSELISRLKWRIAEQDLEIAALKRELASRPLPETVTAVTAVTQSNVGNARLTPAEKQRRYRERKKTGA